jgi:predicted  nucleic acid-binding Zn-ribbon protein
MSQEQQKEVSITPEQDVYSQALEKAQKELASLREDRQKIDGRMAKLEQTIKGLAAICEEQQAEISSDLADLPIVEPEDLGNLGLTGSIRKILSSRQTQMTPTEIRDALVESGMDLDKYSNAMVAIHNTLKRLFDQGELAKSKDEPIRYIWVNEWTRIIRGTEKAALAMRPTFIPGGFELK